MSLKYFELRLLQTVDTIKAYENLIICHIDLPIFLYILIMLKNNVYRRAKELRTDLCKYRETDISMNFEFIFAYVTAQQVFCYKEAIKLR